MTTTGGPEPLSGHRGAEQIGHLHTQIRPRDNGPPIRRGRLSENIRKEVIHLQTWISTDKQLEQEHRQEICVQRGS